jgi:carbohydrate binding protein with CBM4/9 domain
MAISWNSAWNGRASSSGFFLPNPGCQSLQINVTSGFVPAGTWMIALVGWRQTAANSGTTFMVADDAHNQWEPAGAPHGTSSSSGNVQVAVWYAQACATPQTILIAPTNYAVSFIAEIVYLYGMSNGVTVTPTTTAFANSATTLSALTQAAPASQSFVITACVGDVDADTLTLGGSGWTAFLNESVSNGVDTTADLRMNSGIQTPTGSCSATWSSSGTQDLAAIITGWLITATTPSLVSANWPLFTLEIAPGAGYSTPPDQITWTPVASPKRFLSFGMTQGKQYELDQLQAGQGTLLLDNPDGALIPPGTGSFAGIGSGTPVRLRAYWPGGFGPGDRRGPSNTTPWYVVFSGYFERWPQAWDQNTFRGQTEATIIDAWAYMQAQLNTILRIENLNDNPYAYWPCSDAVGSTTASNIANGNTNPLLVTTSKLGGGGSAAAFGQDSGALIGDAGTITTTAGVTAATQSTWWGQTLTGTSASTNGYGFDLSCSDTGYPSVTSGVTIESWFNITATPASTAWTPVIWSARNLKGPVIEVDFNPSSGVIILRYGNGAGASTTINLTSGGYINSGLHHISVAFSQTTYRVMIDGGGNGTYTGTFGASLPAAFTIFTAGGIFTSGVTGYAWTGDTAHIAIFPSILPTVRVLSHYWAGNTGMVQDDAAGRMERLLEGANATFSRRCIQQEAFGGAEQNDIMASCQDVSGQPAGSSINNVVTDTAPSLLCVAPTGDLFWLGKAFSWNQATSWVLGENTPQPLNKNFNFETGTAPWTANNNATISQSSVFAKLGTYSLLIHGNGSTANPYAQSEITIPVTTSDLYACSAWVYSPQGCTAQVLINWFNANGVYITSGTAGTVTLSAGQTSFLQAAASTPAGGTAFASVTVTIVGTPASTTLLYADLVALTYSPGEIPYKGDIAFDYDPTRIVNQIQYSQLDRQDIVTPSVASVEIASRAQYGTNSLQQTGYLYGDLTTGYEYPYASLQDLANWVAETNAAPKLRVSEVTVDAAATPAAWPFVLSACAGDVVLVNRRPPTNTGFVLSTYAKITQVQRTIEFSQNQFTGSATCLLDAAPELNALQCDSAVYGLLNGTNIIPW